MSFCKQSPIPQTLAPPPLKIRDFLQNTKPAGYLYRQAQLTSTNRPFLFLFSNVINPCFVFVHHFFGGDDRQYLNRDDWDAH